MDDWENFTEKAFSFFVEGVSHAVGETQKILEEVTEQVQMLANEMIQEGEVKYHEWLNQQSNYASQPREELRHRMFTLVHGDWRLAERLLDSARKNNPDRSENWYWEKVIYDLERDR